MKSRKLAQKRGGVVGDVGCYRNRSFAFVAQCDFVALISTLFVQIINTLLSC